MSTFFIAFLVALSGTVWLYSKLMYRTGGNVKSALIASAMSGALLFVVLLIILSIIL